MSIEPTCGYCGAVDKFRCKTDAQARRCDEYLDALKLGMADPLPEPPLSGLTGTYDIILADPPWRFSSNSTKRPGKNAMRHYDCMKLDDIKAMPVGDFAAKDALLLMWVTVPFLHLAHQVYEAWGFKYVSALTWPKDRVGTGHWVRNSEEPVLVAERGEFLAPADHEKALICKRGKFPCPKPAPFPTSIIPGAVREHSRKPDWLQDQIDRVWPDSRKLELFARTERPGWTSWGNETDKFSAPAEADEIDNFLGI